MKAVEFCYWLQGMFELEEPESLNKKQTELIKRHLHLMFEHEIDPSYPNRKKLQEIHEGKKKSIQDELDETGGGGGMGGDFLIRC